MIHDILSHNVANITVSSDCVNKDERLKTKCAADKPQVNPRGKNLSPQLNWSNIEDASCYAIIMIDKNAAGWLHWVETGVTTSSLPEGYSSSSAYIGPYPPKMVGEHVYRICVFALKMAPFDRIASLNMPSDLTRIVKKLDNVCENNIVGFGCLDALYKNGDKNI